MKKLKCLSCALLIFSVLVGCGSSVDDDNRGTPNNNGDGRQHGIVPVEYRGQWVYVHNAQEVFLGAYTNLTLEYTDGNIITVKNQNSADRHLIRANSSDVRLHGTVEGLASVSAQSSGNRLMAIGGMNLIARNLTDPNINGQAKTDTDGNYSIDDLPNGSYEVIVDNNTVKTDLIDSDNDLGIITVINDNGCNFKSSVKMDNRFIYGDYTAYNGNVIIQNIGRAECTGLEYTISTTNTYVDNFTFTRTPGTLLPDRSINIPIKVSFKYIDESEKYIPFIIEMRDVRGRVWNDRLRLKVYRSGLTVNFDSQRQVRGQIIVPGQNAVRINSAKTGVTLPEMPGKEYLIVLSNPDDLAYETYYSVGVNTSANNPNSITDNVDKGNNRTDTAKVLNLGGKTDGFLYRGAIHTFKIVMDSGISHKAVDLFVDKMGVFYDTVGNNDGILNKGETARFDIGIHNSGLSTANRVLTTLSVTDPYITITKGSSSYCSNPNIGGGKTVDTSYYGRDSTHFSYLSNGSSNACFQVSVLNTAPDNHIATVTATMTDQFYNVWTDTFNIIVAPLSANLSVVAMGRVYESVGNGDGTLNKGETARFDIGIHNSGSSTANKVVTTLAVTDPYIAITKGSSSYCSNPDIGGGKTVDTSYYGRDSTHFSYLNNGSSNACFQVSVLNTAPDNHIATVTATMTDQFYNVWTDTFNISVLP